MCVIICLRGGMDVCALIIFLRAGLGDGVCVIILMRGVVGG